MYSEWSKALFTRTGLDSSRVEPRMYGVCTRLGRPTKQTTTSACAEVVAMNHRKKRGRLSYWYIDLTLPQLRSSVGTGQSTLIRMSTTSPQLPLTRVAPQFGSSKAG